VQAAQPAQQQASGAAGGTWAESKGMIATLQMKIDLCQANQQDSVTVQKQTEEEDNGPGNGPTSSAASLLKNALLHLSMGELSRYKGYEHINDNLAKVVVPTNHDAPDEFSLREHFPMCFPLDYTEVVRDQGNCGSCWAMATASSAMNNICFSSRGGSIPLYNADDRFEISVQQIMSCNSMERGCEGGSATSADDAMQHGLTKERDSPYQCGSGDALNHFEQSGMTCEAFPWGGTCDNSKVNSQWKFGGVSAVNGEDAMKSILSLGYALYVTFDVYGNFMTLRAGQMFTAPSGDKLGGHAVTAVAYGSKDGTPYWLIQNSWGTSSWADKGYGMFKRGSNLCGIEEASYYVRAWAAGAQPPPCFNGAATGLVAGNTQIPCSEAKNGEYGNLCDRDLVKRACPLACDSCIGDDGEPAPSPPAPELPNDPPAPAPPASGGESGRCIQDATDLFPDKHKVKVFGFDVLGAVNTLVTENVIKKCFFMNRCTYSLRCQCPAFPGQTFQVGNSIQSAELNGQPVLEMCTKGKCTCAQDSR
jgi:C1A family cysteine protease